MHDTSGLQLAYTMVLGSMFAALFWERASTARILVAPLVAVLVTLAASVTVALLSLPEGLLAGVSAGAQAVFHSSIILVMGLTAGRGLARWRAAAPGRLYQRGAVRVETLRGEPAAAGSLSVAGVAVPEQDETQHFKLIGTPGTGKSTAIRELLGAALARGDRAVIADPDGGYLQRFYAAPRGDVILNPFHTQSRKWDLFAEIDAERDIEPLSRSLIPDGSDDERVRNGYARTFLGELIRYCRREGTSTDQALHNLVAATSQTDLRAILAGGPAGPFLEAGNERMFGAVRSVAASALRALALTSAQAGEPFSVRRWVREGHGVLFLPYRAGEIAALRTVISAWTRLAIFQAMDGPEGDRHLWFIVDELDALGAIDGLEDALGRLRKFGGRCVLGLQSMAQLSSTYGHGVAQSIVENTGNTLILRCSASEQGGTAQYASRLIGEHQILRRIISSRVRAFLPALPLFQPYTDAVVLPSQIERLPDLQGFLKLASNPQWCSVRLTPDIFSTVPRAQPVPVEQPAAACEPQAPAAEPVDKDPRTPTEPPVPALNGKTEAAPKRTRRKPAAGAAAARKGAVMPVSARPPEVSVVAAPVVSGTEMPAAIEAGLQAVAREGDVPQEKQT